jgi:hypothetical protein
VCWIFGYRQCSDFSVACHFQTVRFSASVVAPSWRPGISMIEYPKPFDPNPCSCGELQTHLWSIDAIFRDIVIPVMIACIRALPWCGLGLDLLVVHWRMSWPYYQSGAWVGEHGGCLQMNMWSMRHYGWHYGRSKRMLQGIVGVGRPRFLHYIGTGWTAFFSVRIGFDPTQFLACYCWRDLGIALARSYYNFGMLWDTLMPFPCIWTL